MSVDPYNRIIRAAKAGRGVRLSAADALELAADDAIASRAAVMSSWAAGECSACLGTGRMSGEACGSCAGSGKPEGSRVVPSVAGVW